MTEVEKLEDRLGELWRSLPDNVDLCVVDEMVEIGVKLGRVSVYNENGWNEEDAL